MNYKIFLLLIFTLLFSLLSGCKKNKHQYIKPSNINSTLDKIKKLDNYNIEPLKNYVYEGTKFRDPMKKALKRRTVTKVRNHKLIKTKTSLLTRLKRFKLTGIITNEKIKYAILENKFNKLFYIVRDGRVFDTNEKVVKGLNSIIKEDKVIIMLVRIGKKVVYTLDKTFVNDLIETDSK